MADQGNTDQGNGVTKRRDPRYVETSADLSDWIRVRLARAFGPPLQASGLLVDLTPQAVRVALPDADFDPERVFAKGAKILVTFRFRDLATTTAAATVGRIDTLDRGTALVLFFDTMTEPDREGIARICAAFQGRGGGAAGDRPADAPR